MSISGPDGPDSDEVFWDVVCNRESWFYFINLHLSPY